MRMIEFESTSDISDMIGVTMAAVEIAWDRDEVRFKAADGRAWHLYHIQDCCESVTIEDVVGDLSDLVGSPILMTEEATSRPECDPDETLTGDCDSRTWTFYKFATVKGYVTLRWLGVSNGYYSESVDFGELCPLAPNDPAWVDTPPGEPGEYWRRYATEPPQLIRVEADMTVPDDRVLGWGYHWARKGRAAE